MLKRSYKLYDSIMIMPIDIWLTIHETGDLRRLIVSGNPSPEVLHETWLDVREQHLKEFGINDNLKRYFEKRKMLIYAMCDYGIDPSPINKTMLDIAEKDLDDFQNEGEKGNFSILYAQIEKYMGFKLERASTSVFDFYNYSRTLQNDINGRKDN